MRIDSGTAAVICSDGFRRSVMDNLGRDPFKIALDSKLPHASLVATQVKYLIKAKDKLPSYFEAGCVMSPTAYEQSTAEAVARSRPYGGGLCIDLTCGLGVDSYYLSKRFEKVIALERDPAVAMVARRNFELLGARNIELVECPAEEFINSCGMTGADLIFCDPDRRDASGGRKVTTWDCSPDVVELMPTLMQISREVVVKLSPLFDVAEAVRLFGPHAAVGVVSLDGECKELNVRVSPDFTSPVVQATALGKITGQYSAPYHSTAGVPGAATDGKAPLPDYRYLVVPDAALSKSGLAASFYVGKGVAIDGPHSFGFAKERPREVFGRLFEIIWAEPYSVKALRRKLKDQGVHRLNILRRDCPMSAAEIARAAGVTERGSQTIAVTSCRGELWAMGIDRIG